MWKEKKSATAACFTQNSALGLLGRHAFPSCLIVTARLRQLLAILLLLLPLLSQNIGCNRVVNHGNSLLKLNAGGLVTA